MSRHVEFLEARVFSFFWFSMRNAMSAMGECAVLCLLVVSASSSSTFWIRL